MIIHGDSIEKLKLMDENSVDAVVTDPPYGWRFMGKAWDGADIDKMAKAATGKEPRLCADGRMRKPRENCSSIAAGTYDTSLTGNQAFQFFTEEWAREALRVLKPGGHMLVFCGPRTYHRMASGLEDAGFEIRDQLQWLFGSGFPKSMDISKAIDKQAGAEREVIGPNPSSRPNHGQNENLVALNQLTGACVITAPSTDEAKKWQGFGTALKPANEPICLARKPLSEKTVAANVLKYGTGGLNIDASRIEAADQAVLDAAVKRMTGNAANAGAFQSSAQIKPNSAQGRWPANLLLDESAAEMLDEQSGTSGGGKRKDANARVRQGFRHGTQGESLIEGRSAAPDNYGDSGGASRFFYVAKASKKERNAGLEGMPEKAGTKTNLEKLGPNGSHRMANAEERSAGLSIVEKNVGANHHPTVKPIKLMEYLIRLVTPPGGIVLDPFMGSGSTGVAAKNLGFQFIGIDMNEEYVEIAKRRIDCLG